jgi:hypothetical protein
MTQRGQNDDLVGDVRECACLGIADGVLAVIREKDDA